MSKLAIGAAVVVQMACAGPEGPPGPEGPAGGGGGITASDAEALVNQKLNTVDRSLALWNIQSGLGTVMIEYNIRFNNLWFAGQSNNWDMARYQVKEMREIQAVAEVTRPARAPLLQAFATSFLARLDNAIASQDPVDFATAYDQAIAGCNGCHAASSSPDFPSFNFVKVTRPTASHFQNVDWTGQGTTQ
ncbi:MAG: hypothetical protein HYZ28_14465 [Myxococcales bacterium]|nr:hypothetical protein [Myxococcales bacterium]